MKRILLRIRNRRLHNFVEINQPIIIKTYAKIK